MVKVDVFKTQRIGGKTPQYMQSIGYVKDSDAENTAVCSEETEQSPQPILSDADWMDLYDDEIGYWESIRPFWF